jgi:acyl-coenzyme A thioesterase PaaI-like protein
MMATRFELLQATLMIRTFGWLKIPLLAYTRPSVLALDEDHCVVRIKLGRRTGNHLGSMYVGALAIGADCASGLIAASLIRKRQAKVTLAFKSMSATFLKRAESDVFFVCEEGAKIRALVERTLASEERQTMPVHLRAEVRSPEGPETVAEFVMELSLKQSTKGTL